MKALDELAKVSPISRSLPSEGILLEALERCYEQCGGIESLSPFEQHEVLVRSEKTLHEVTRGNLAANVAYSLLFQYHAQLLETHFEEFKPYFEKYNKEQKHVQAIVWTRDFDVNFMGGKTAFDAPTVHGVPTEGFYKVAKQHYQRSKLGWPHIEGEHAAKGAHPMAYRYARWAITNFHLYQLGLARGKRNADYFATAISAGCRASELSVPWSEDFGEVSWTVEALTRWLRDQDVPGRDDFRQALNDAREKLYCKRQLPRRDN